MSGRGRHHRWLVIALAAAFSGGLGLWATSAAAHPFRGSVPWSVLLCRFSDSPAPPRSVADYQRLFFQPGAGGAADYWNAVSYGGINFAGSQVLGWYTEAMTVAQAKSRSRNDKINDCLNTARAAQTNPYTVPPGRRIAIVTSPEIDLFGWKGGAFLPDSVDVSSFAHEGGHGLGLTHSYSDDPSFRDEPWAQIGEYDDKWDVMSWANVFSTSTVRFGSGGPGLNAYHVDQMGWLPRSRILTFGADGMTTGTVTLAALNHPETAGRLLVRVPFDATDPFHYFTVEYRRNDGWDAGFPSSIVLIHEIKRRSDNRYYSYLLRDRAGARAPVQSIVRNGVSITVVGSSGNRATVRISSSAAAGPSNPARFVFGPNTCARGYVWREADDADWVCVTPKVRTQTLHDNASAASRRNLGGGPNGADTCRQGFVWRDAFPGDHVCVRPQIRDQAGRDNARAESRLLRP